MTPRIYIVARRRDQAAEFAAQRRLTDWRHVNTADQLRGIENPQVIYLPGWTALAEAEGIHQMERLMTRPTK